MRYHAPRFRIANRHAPRAQVRGEVFGQHSEQVRDRLHGLTLIDMTALPLPPDYLLDGIGHGDYESIGKQTAELIERFAGLRPDDRLLDIGSGLGRVTRFLLPKLTEGTYDGIDTIPTYVAWCNSALAVEGRVQFHLADLYSSFYNPTGTVRPEEYRFPWPDNAFTLTVATSLFTHLSAPACANYIRESFRTLAPGGRLFASFFVIDGYAKMSIKWGTIPPFEHEFEQGRISDPQNPDFAVAFDAQWLLDQFQGTGYEILGFERGEWRYMPGPSYQDLVIARKPG